MPKIGYNESGEIILVFKLPLKKKHLKNAFNLMAKEGATIPKQKMELVNFIKQNLLNSLSEQLEIQFGQGEDGKVEQLSKDIAETLFKREFEALVEVSKK